MRTWAASSSFARLSLASAAVRRVYLQRAASIHNDGRSLRGSLVKTTLVLAVIGIVPFGLSMLGPVLQNFGTKEQQDTILPRILSGAP